MTHDPLCEWLPCTCPLDYDVPERGHMIGCPEDDCECEIIAKVRADEAPKAVTRWIEQGASSDDWMKVWQVRDYAEELEAKVRANEKAKWTHTCPDNNCCNGGPN